MINLSGSMRYGPTGKKRKTNAWSSKKRKSLASKSLRSCPLSIARMEEAKKHREMYPSWTGTTNHTPSTYDDSYKKEVSKNYTVSIAYNKGAYQVIPRSEVKNIGK